MQFAYDGRDRVRSVIDPKGNVTRYKWNQLDQLLTLNDPDLGQRTFTYDKLGNMLTSTDARNRTTTYTYDALDRPKTRKPPFGSLVTWNYDEPGRGAYKGRLTSMVDDSAAGCTGSVAERREYDGFGRLSAVSQCIAGQTFQIGLTYDTLNRTRTLRYPDGEVVRYGYNRAGWLDSVSGWINTYGYDAAGRVTSIDYANAVKGKIRYQPFRGQVEHEQYRARETSIFNADYTYELDGTLRSSSSSTNAMSLQFTHDELGRLTGVSGDQTQIWQYDVDGNMMSNSKLGTYSYPAPGPTGCPVGGAPAPCLAPHGVRGAGKYQLLYDANGLVSQVTDTSTGNHRNIDWTADFRPMVVQDYDGTVTQYTYDGMGRRVMEQSGAETIRHVGSLVDVSTSTGMTKRYFAGRRFIGTSRGRVRSWFHADRGGSVRAVTDATGALVARIDFEPYGTRVAGSPAGAPNVFRGLPRLPQDAALFVGDRYYDSEIGRFLSPDVIVPDALQSQALNRYAFNYNSPTMYTDPTGHVATSIARTVGNEGQGEFGDTLFPWTTIPVLTSPPTPLAPGPTSLNFSPLQNWVHQQSVVDREDDDIDDEDQEDHEGVLGETLWENKEEIAFGALTGILEGGLPAGWLLPFDKVGAAVHFNEDQQFWFDLSRGISLASYGLIEVASGIAVMGAGAPPTIVGGVTVETGVGTIVFAGGAVVEAAGAVVAVEGVTDVIAGLGILYRSGIYILVDRKGNIRYIGKAKSFPTRKYSHKQNKPGHKFYELDINIKDKDVRTFLETWAIEKCKTCDWNKINGMSSENVKFMRRQIKTLMWLDEHGLSLPATLEELIIKQTLLR